MINLGDISLSKDKCTYIAGPCAVESEEQIFTIANHVSKKGANILRGGAFKPRTSPNSFQGLGQKGLELLFSAAKENSIPVVTEVLDINQIEIIKKAAKGHPFIFQIGSRNSQNYSLLSEVGKTGYPVLLKRGKGSTVEEMLGAAEYIKNGGSKVIMCERGIVTFSSGSGCARFTADHIAILKFQEAGYITLFDPSHPAGNRKYVTPLALSGIAIGADGLIVEVHNKPEIALSDRDQAITLEDFDLLINKSKSIEQVLKQSLKNNVHLLEDKKHLKASA